MNADLALLAQSSSTVDATAYMESANHLNQYDMPKLGTCSHCLKTASPTGGELLTIASCPATSLGEAHGSGQTGFCDDCLKKAWLNNRERFNQNHENAASVERMRYYNRVNVACGHCLWKHGAIRVLEL